jgi:hypothetical protein
MCLNYVCNVLTEGRGLGVYAPYALHAWRGAKHRHPGDKRPPAGVPVYWDHGTSNHFGHVALSVGGGRVRSTGIGKPTDVGELTIDELSRSWGRTYLGWAEDMYGTRIPGIAGGEEMDMTTDDSVRRILREELARAMTAEDADERVRRIVREELDRATSVQLTDAQMGFIGTKARGWSLTKAIGYIAGQSALSRKRTGHLVNATDDIGEDLDAIKDKVNG